MLWKIYFFVISSIVLFGTYYQVRTSDLNLLDGVEIFLGVLPLLGGYAYVFKKKILSGKQWKIILYVLVGKIILGVALQIPTIFKENNLLLAVSIGLISFALLDFPLFYAIHMLSKGVAQSKKLKSRQRRK